jgi:hypothetical protein
MIHVFKLKLNHPSSCSGPLRAGAAATGARPQGDDRDGDDDDDTS